MDKKVFRKIYREFESKYPQLSKHVIHACPYEFATIALYLDDGTKLAYSYESERAIVLGDRWKEE